MTKNMAGKYQVAFSTDTLNNFPTDYAMHEARSKQIYDENVRELQNRKREIVDFNKTAKSGPAPILDNFYYIKLYGRNSKEIYKLVELPSQYNNFKYELYGSFGEIDSVGKVRTYSYDAERVSTLEV